MSQIRKVNQKRHSTGVHPACPAAAACPMELGRLKYQISRVFFSLGRGVSWCSAFTGVTCVLLVAERWGFTAWYKALLCGYQLFRKLKIPEASSFGYSWTWNVRITQLREMRESRLSAGSSQARCGAPFYWSATLHLHSALKPLLHHSVARAVKVFTISNLTFCA